MKDQPLIDKLETIKSEKIDNFKKELDELKKKYGVDLEIQAGLFVKEIE